MNQHKETFRQKILDNITANEEGRDLIITLVCTIILLAMAIRQGPATSLEKFTVVQTTFTILVRLLSDITGLKANLTALNEFDAVFHKKEWPKPKKYPLLSFLDKYVTWCFLISLGAFTLSLILR